jgi:hypothetical protein
MAKKHLLGTPSHPRQLLPSPPHTLHTSLETLLSNSIDPKSIDPRAWASETYLGDSEAKIVMCEKKMSMKAQESRQVGKQADRNARREGGWYITFDQPEGTRITFGPDKQHKTLPKLNTFKMQKGNTWGFACCEDDITLKLQRGQVVSGA